MTHSLDLPRLRATLGSSELVRLLDALQRRAELGRPLQGLLTLTGATPGERNAVDALLGRNSTRGSSLRIDLDELATILSDAGLCESLASALQALRGTIVDRHAAMQQADAAWRKTWEAARGHFASQPILTPWLAKLDRLGVVRRLCNGEPAAGSTLLRSLAHAVAHLPVRAEPLPSFAARLFGNAHALDPGTPLATLAVRAAAHLGGVVFEDCAEGRRTAWAGVGIMCDELSTPVLTYNLAPHDKTPLGRLLRSAQADTEPVHLSLRLLLRTPLGLQSGLAGVRIFVCENPTMVALAAEQLGSKCAPLVCVNGQFATPALVLLRQLRDAGAELHYHGDFDPTGLAIARRAMKEGHAQPWRFGAGDYQSAPKGLPLTGSAGPTPWDPALREAMLTDGRAVHEEAVFKTLIPDLIAQPQNQATRLTP